MLPEEPLPPTPPPPKPAPQRERRAATGGVILVLIGLFFLLNNLFPGVVGRSFLLLVGVAFLLAYLLGGRNVGFLIPGSILSGLGLGALIASWLPGRESGGVVLLCLGLGFLAIWLFERGQQWSLVPGGVLVVIGAVVSAGLLVQGDVARWWPVVLVLVGLWVLFRRAQAARRGG